MTTISINFDALRDASSKARDVAQQLDNYADSLNSSVERPLGRLTGGSTSNTSSASSIAAAKARDLRNRSDGYRRLSMSVQSFADSASQVDKQVGCSIARVADGYAADLPFWSKVGRELYSLFNGALGKTELGNLVKQIANWMKAGFGLAGKVLKKAYDWFRHGKGRYYVSGFLAFAGFIGALATFVGTFPVSGVVAAIVAVASGIALLKSGFDFIVSSRSAWEGISNNDTEPGYARYRGSASTLTDRMKMDSTSRSKQTAASVFDTVGNIVGVVASIGKLFKVKAPLSKDAEAPIYKMDAFLVNLREGLGFSAKTEVDGNGVTQFVTKDSKIQFEWNHSYWGISDKWPENIKFDSAKNAIKSVDELLKPEKNLANAIQFLTTGDQTIYKKISDANKELPEKVWDTFGVVIKGASSVFTGITLPKMCVSTGDYIVKPIISLVQSTVEEAVN